MSKLYIVFVADWQKYEQEIRRLREYVFVGEQSVPKELEFDGLDPASTHVLALTNSGEAIGTGRVRANGHIGRMAVHPQWRKQGVGSRILACLLQVARQAQPRVTPYLNAQTTAVGFYQRHGFMSVGKPFTQANIPHQKMVFHAKSHQ